MVLSHPQDGLDGDVRSIPVFFDLVTPAMKTPPPPQDFFCRVSADDLEPLW